MIELKHLQLEALESIIYRDQVSLEDNLVKSLLNDTSKLLTGEDTDFDTNNVEKVMTDYTREVISSYMKSISTVPEFVKSVFTNMELSDKLKQLGDDGTLYNNIQKVARENGYLEAVRFASMKIPKLKGETYTPGESEDYVNRVEELFVTFNIPDYLIPHLEDDEVSFTEGLAILDHGVKKIHTLKTALTDSLSKALTDARERFNTYPTMKPHEDGSINKVFVDMLQIMLVNIENTLAVLSNNNAFNFDYIPIDVNINVDDKEVYVATIMKPILPNLMNPVSSTEIVVVPDLKIGDDAILDTGTVTTQDDVYDIDDGLLQKQIQDVVAFINETSDTFNTITDELKVKVLSTLLGYYASTLLCSIFSVRQMNEHLEELNKHQRTLQDLNKAIQDVFLDMVK